MLKEKAKQYYKDNRNRKKEQPRLYGEDHWERQRKRKSEYGKQYRKDHPEAMERRGKQWRMNNPGYMKHYREDNPEYDRKWRMDNREHIKHREKNRYKTDLKFNLNRRMGAVIKQSLRGNKGGRSWESLVGYTLEDLIKRLKRTMPKGYTWQDYLDGKLQVDHIIPRSAFNYTKHEHIDFQKCWALTNLQLLTAKKNRKKSYKVEKPFQPALTISI